MQLGSYAVLPLASRVLVALGWVGFFLFFFARAGASRDAGSGEAKRDRVSLVGIALQGVGFALVWMLERPLPRAGTPLGPWEIGFDVLGPVLSVLSAWIGLAAVRTLGKQWSYAARLIEGHRLVIEGPYRIVRHPIYSAMLGKLLATACAFGHPIGALIASAVFLAGTAIRIRSEEKLLRGQFGAEYEAYARRVPALVPGLR